MDNGQPDIGDAFRTLKESLGSLLYCWCRLEDELADVRKSVGLSGSGSAAGFGERLLEFRRYLEARASSESPLAEEIAGLMARIDEARTTRNLVVHSLAGISADPRQGEPHITCRTLRHGRQASVTITQSALTELCAALGRCQQDLGRLEFLARQRDQAAR